ncbi:hypothetical protein D3C87_1706430 [compost metagenome]
MLLKWYLRPISVVGLYLLLITETSGRKVLNWLRREGKRPDPTHYVLALISLWLFLTMLSGAAFGLWKSMTPPV